MEPIMNTFEIGGADGKTLRGSGVADGPGRHLLAALDHAYGVVLGRSMSVLAKSEVQNFKGPAWQHRPHQHHQLRPCDNPLQATIVLQGGMVNMGLSENVRD